MSRAVDAFEDHRRVLDAASREIPALLEQAADLALRCLRRGGMVLACGNGGSAADAQHFVAELVGRFGRDGRRPLPAVTLGTNAAVLTAVSNDFGYELSLARELRALASSGDLLVAISTSGDSENVLAAARAAADIGCDVAALTGRDGGALAALADPVIAVPSVQVARIQEIHALCLHVLCELIDEQMDEEER